MVRILLETQPLPKPDKNFKILQAYYAIKNNMLQLLTDFDTRNETLYIIVCLPKVQNEHLHYVCKNFEVVKDAVNILGPQMNLSKIMDELEAGEKN